MLQKRPLNKSEALFSERCLYILMTQVDNCDILACTYLLLSLAQMLKLKINLLQQ